MEFLSKLAGAWSGPVKDTLLNYQLQNPQAPEGLQKMGNVFNMLLNRGPLTVQDNTGSFSFDPRGGQFEVMGKNLGLGVSANQYDPGAQLKFRFGKAAEQPVPPQMMSDFLNESNMKPTVSPAKQELETQLDAYRSNNPYYYRP